MSRLTLIFMAAALVMVAQAMTIKENNVTLSTRACQGEHANYPFCNVSLAIDDRVMVMSRGRAREE
jgi:hypothetical protein